MGVGSGQLDELIVAIEKGLPLVQVAARRLSQRMSYSAENVDRELVDAWLRLVMDVAVIVADSPRLANKEMGARLQQQAADLAAVCR